jgi:hypothetical protein
VLDVDEISLTLLDAWLWPGHGGTRGHGGDVSKRRRIMD